MKTIRHTKIKTNQEEWLINPKPGHLVHFYDFEVTLLQSLLLYIGGGLQGSDTCVAIATRTHLNALNAELERTGINVKKARLSGQYIALDANETLESFMRGGKPDKSLFLEHVGAVIQATAKKGNMVRAFGEMVAILWKKGNFEAVTMLEEYWNELGRKHEFSLYCAYPMLTFDREVHGQEIKSINQLHTHTKPVFAPLKSQQLVLHQV